jgi:hypothetical protein
MKNKEYIIFSKLPKELSKTDIQSNTKYAINNSDENYFYFGSDSQYKVNKYKTSYFTTGEIVRREYI